MLVNVADRFDTRRSGRFEHSVDSRSEVPSCKSLMGRHFHGFLEAATPYSWMASKRYATRRWGTWWPRFRRVLYEDVGSLAGLGSLILTAAAYFLSNASWLAVIACVILGSVIIYAGWRSFPETLIDTVALVDSQTPVPLEALGRLDKPVTRLGVVGTAQSGKTTFLERLLGSPTETATTNEIGVRMTILGPERYFALIDGDGGFFSQQFDVSSHVDFLLVFLDHNEGADRQEVSSGRKQGHENFLEQLRAHLIQEGNAFPRSIHFALNKRDLWEKQEGANLLRKWFCDLVEQWRSFGMAKSVSFSVHSNLFAKDIAQLSTTIRESTKQ